MFPLPIISPLVFPRLQGVKITHLKFSCQVFSDFLVTVYEFPDITRIPLSLSTSPFITLIPRHLTIPEIPEIAPPSAVVWIRFRVSCIIDSILGPTKLSRNDWFRIGFFGFWAWKGRLMYKMLKMVYMRVFYWSWSCGCCSCSCSCSSEISLKFFHLYLGFPYLHLHRQPHAVSVIGAGFFGPLKLRHQNHTAVISATMWN